MTRRKLPVKAYKNLDFLTSNKARPIRILSEFSEPYHRFIEYNIDSTVVFFGSARIKPKPQAKKELLKLAEEYEKNQSVENEERLSAARLQLRLSKYYEDIPLITKHFNSKCDILRLTPLEEERLCILFVETEEPYERWKKTIRCTRKNYMSYPYVCRKLCQMLDWTQHMKYFPLLF